ncbi:cobalamin B12-binding domain-containing protein [Actinokineospora bangkokensis]|uniref:Twin-arginine translocation pathway signal protein n=1 Tax=Actinokineospora bangkokensis TaxID=1193682 RepID=A0A1Q9LQ79_9PSEU|nr:cobalamin-dependent protein [Actinokineospora bangkokensis]OLR94180.1 twin-arginine translocation pathway signal protein [Actinokineospora bangkokensis]
MTATGADAPPDAFAAALVAADLDAATAAVTALLDAGTDPLAVLVDVIGPAQRRAGDRWQRGEWSVAQEHAATAVAVAATEVVARRVARTPATRGRVVVACAEREWHALAASLVGCALRTAGWEVTQLGASTSPLRLSQYLHDLGPDATAVSASVLGALPNTRRFIEASTTAGIPVVVGGPAFGPDATRALALGATAWAPDARTAIDVVAGLPLVVPAAPPLPADAVAEQAALELSHQRLVVDLAARWMPGAAVTGTPPLHGIAAVVGDVVAQALHAVSAALLTGDPRPLPAIRGWARELLVARGADPELATALGVELAAVLREHPLALDLVERHWCGAPLTSGPQPS